MILKDIERFFKEGKCEYKNCTENENAICYLWKQVKENGENGECYIRVDGDGYCWDYGC